MNAKRLLKLAEFLDTLPRQKFKFSTVADERGKSMREALKAGKTRCGTVGCALGWAPVVFPRLLRWVEVRKWFPDDKAMYAVCHRSDTRTQVPASQMWPETRATAAAVFGLWEADVQFLFQPEDSGLGEDATPKQVARHIRQFVRNAQRTGDSQQ